MGDALFHAMKASGSKVVLRVVAALHALAVAVLVKPSSAQEDVEAFARVVVAETELRSGPGIAHRVIHRARRGETFAIEGRETSGFWYEVLLSDGRRAYILGDTVDTIAVGPGDDGPSRPGVFAPPALESAHAGFAMAGGAFDQDGYVELRPSWIIAPAIALEPYVGLALQSDGRRLVYGAAGTLNLAPDWALAPFVSIGTGGVHEEPKEEFVREARSLFHTRAGGGVLVSLRWRVLLRVEAGNTTLFSEDSYQNVQSYTAGVGTYF
jgi:hypothetical protein